MDKQRQGKIIATWRGIIEQEILDLKYFLMDLDALARQGTATREEWSAAMHRLGITAAGCHWGSIECSYDNLTLDDLFEAITGEKP